MALGWPKTAKLTGILQTLARLPPKLPFGRRIPSQWRRLRMPKYLRHDVSPWAPHKLPRNDLDKCQTAWHTPPQSPLLRPLRWVSRTTMPSFCTRTSAHAHADYSMSAKPSAPSLVNACIFEHSVWCTLLDRAIKSAWTRTRTSTISAISTVGMRTTHDAHK